jgi:hypothetical protein
MPHKLKDLARLTLRFTSCSHMAHALAEGPQGAGIEVLTLKNKYASPTPMGSTPTSTRLPASCFRMARGTCARSSSTT